MTELVDACVLDGDGALDRLRALGHDDDREARPVAVAQLDPRAHLLDVERNLGHQHDVGAAGDARVRRDPPGVTSHHLDHHHPVVALGGGVQPVDRVGRDLHRGLETEREVGGRQVVVDRLRDADHGLPVLGERGGDAERVLAADRDERVDPFALERVVHACHPAVHLARVRPRRAEDRATAVQEPACVGDRQFAHLAFDDAAPPVTEPDDLVAVHAFTLAHDRADHRVESGAVAASREHTDAHRALLSSEPVPYIMLCTRAPSVTFSDGAPNGVRPVTNAGIAARAEPLLDPGDEVVGTAVVWAARIGRTPSWLTGRHRHSIVLTGRRVLMFERRHRSEEPSLDVPLNALALERTRPVLWFTQVVVHADDRRLVLEFRMRDRATRVAFIDALRGTQRT